MRFIDWVAESAGELAEPAPGKEWVWLAGLLIVTIPGVLAAWWAREAKRESRATNEQVINDDETQPVLRKDIDDKHDELLTELGAVKTELGGVKAVLGEHGIRLGSIEEHLRN